MKVFWAWQSDIRPGKTSRHFIREALEEAIARINEAQDIVEPDEGFQNAFELDHDRKGLRGSPDLANAILAKIAASSVFVADVTPIAKGAPYKSDDGKAHDGKLVMNPNVAVELGYALNALTTERILMVLNTHYGTRDSVPFDLAHKAGPILYRLAPDATAADIKAEKRKLVSVLADALEPYQEQVAVKPFPERPFISSRAFFAPEPAIIGDVGSEYDKMRFRIEHQPAMYLRVMPNRELDRPLITEQLIRTANRLGTFGLNHGGIVRTNADGVACFDPRGNTELLDSFSQAFRSGELWGINITLFANGARQNPKVILQNGLEQVFCNYLSVYIDYMKNVSHIEPPYTVEAGITGVKGWNVYSYGVGTGTYFGDVYENELHHRRVLKTAEPASQNKFLLEFFEKIFLQTGRDRPQGLNGFPPP